MSPVAASSTDFLNELKANSKVEDVQLSRLQIDYTYQRDVSETLVDEIANNWDVVASEQILVSNRGARNGSDIRGGLFIVNGQHRSKAAQKKGLATIEARVIDLRKEEDPAAIEAGFRLKTNVRLGDQPLERFKAELRAGDPRAQEIKKILAQFGTMINEQTNTETGINAVVSVESIYDYDGGGLLRDTLTLVKETYAKTVISVVLTLIIYWFAHSYAEFASERLKDREPLRLGVLGRIMVLQVPILFGAAIPLVAVLVLWAVNASLSTAVTAAVWTSAVVVMLIEVLAGLRAKRTGRELVFQTAFGALLGLLIIVLRLTLH